MKRMTNSLLLFTCGLIVAAGLLLSGCEEAATDAADDASAPSKIVGTLAIGDISGTFELNFASKPQGSGGIASRAIYTVTGKVTVAGSDFSLTSGTYESSTGAVTATTETLSTEGGPVKFRILAVYSESAGLSGTIEYYLSGAVAAVGGIAGTPSTPADTAKNYFGTFLDSEGVEGVDEGTWNATIRGSTMVGSYSNTDPADGGGTFQGTVSGTTIVITKATMAEGEVITFSGSGTITGTSINGTYSYTATIPEGPISASGTWTGTEVAE